MALEDLADNLEEIEQDETIVIEQVDDEGVYVLGYSGADGLPATTVEAESRSVALKKLAGEIDYYESTPEEDW